jgi:hypothetical protein
LRRLSHCRAVLSVHARCGTPVPMSGVPLQQRSA